MGGKGHAALLRYFVVPATALTGIFAQAISIDLDPSKTKIDFALPAALHTVHGSFKLRSGHIEVDPASKAISGQVLVDASSGESGSAVRDNRMKKNILESERYPTITFTAASIQGDIPAVTVIGWFAIHGERHQLSIPMEVKMSGGEVTAKGKFAVPYVAWGMRNPSTFFLHVDQQVEVDIIAVGALLHGDRH